METKNSVGPTALADGRPAPTVDTIIRQVSKAELLVGLGQVDEAISTLKEILRLNPDSTHAHMKLKDVFLRAGMRTQAAEECIQLARILEAQGDLSASRDYIARAHLLSPATVDPSSSPRVSNEAPTRVHPTSPTGFNERSRQPQPQLQSQPQPQPQPRTNQEAPKATSRPEPTPLASNPAAPLASAQPVAKNPSPSMATPKLSGPAPRNQAPEAGPPPPLPRASVPSLPIDRGSPPSKNRLGDLREPPPNGKPSVAPGPEQVVATVSLKDLQEIHRETVSADSLSLTANPLVATRAAIQAPVVSTEPSAKVIVSSKEKRRRPRPWFYAVAATVFLSAAGVQGLFWYDARLDKDFTALHNQYEEIAQANAVAQAQPEIVEYVTTEETVPASETEETQPTKTEQDSLEAKKSQTQPSPLRPTPASEQTGSKPASAMAALRPEPSRPELRQNLPAPPPMTSQVTLGPSESQVDNRTLAPVGTSLGAAPPPPPASPPPASTRVVVAAEATSKSQPAYPRAAAMAGISGSVSIQVSINERGTVVDARAISGPPLLRDAAVNAARRWRFKPSTIGGVPVSATKTIVFNFKPDK